MSVGNLKTQGNQGNNFPYQLRALQLASLSQFEKLHSKVVTDPSSSGLASNVDAFFASYPNSFLVSQSVVWDGTNYTAFITYAKL